VSLSHLQSRILSREEVLHGYDVVSALYPHVPPMSMWRAWEHAAYRRHSLTEPVLDVGCGDGRFFRLMWPGVRDVVGIDSDTGVAEGARRSSAYREVHVSSADELSIPAGGFASAFANCSLEHMDHLPEVLRSIRRGLRPRGWFLCSVITDKWKEWASIPLLLDALGCSDHKEGLQAHFEAYHHLVNIHPVERWVELLEEAGLDVLEHIPIVPELSSRLFLFLDHLWHVPHRTGEIGDFLSGYAGSCPDFPAGFASVLAGILRMERDWSVGSGAVLWARRKE
jgi:SAM-dependent methyltransferase